MKLHLRFLIYFFILALPHIGKANVQKFFLLPPAKIDLNQLDLKKFEERLYQIAPQSNPTEVKKQFIEFYSEFSQIIESRRTQNPYIQFSILNKKNVTSLGTEISLKIESLYKRPNTDPNNWIEAYFYLPVTGINCLENKIPGTVILQHIRNRIDLERRVAKFMTLLNNGDEQSIFVFSFPQYGKRNNSKEGFFTSDLSLLRSHFLQTLLDIHVAYSFLHAHPYVDPQNINLYGTSLGAILGYLAAGTNPIFDSYSFLGGGGNLYKILTSRALNNPESDLSQLVKELKDIQQLQNSIAFMDPLLWSSFLKNKRVQILHAKRDELIDYKESLEPIILDYKEQKNSLQLHMLNLGHGASVGFKALFDIFFPIKTFLAKEAKECSSL
ncbi:MAG TPA: hypothetical protein PLJ21_00530 [Pseudobdellovibrionaceae bacterium]|nr:hypothetical protein [Pseudobdellovibrionaceae bacterium]